MKTLQFGSATHTHEGRRIRTARFKARSALPVAAACVVANAMRETLSSLTGERVAVHLFEPVIPDDRAWAAIARDASIFRVAGPRLDAAVVLRPHDGLTLASVLFGEAQTDERALSVLERTVLSRAVQALAGSLAPVCGFHETPAAEPILDIRRYATYFEVQVEQPARARIGIALSRDPQPEPSASRLHPAQLMDVEIEVSVELARGVLDAAALLALREGAYVPMTSKVGDDGLLRAGTTIIARGECGAQGARAAMLVRSSGNGVIR